MKLVIVELTAKAKTIEKSAACFMHRRGRSI